ncbi:hypothetical protein F5Y15DRAFT_103155 [Xylariaceae sp. FL0016]|nr:hypothetical protein F5Y15DRAFT_103155 [Xylariaceae sp. FL0016]
MQCALPPHRNIMLFKTYAEYDSHYSQTHTNRCVECSKNFPSTHLLDVHFEDCHDSFAAVKREKGERTYSCFVEDCARKCRTPYKRRQHLIDKHLYPANYFFEITRDGIDGRKSLLKDGWGHHRRRSSTATSASGTKAVARRHSLRSEASKSGSEEENKTNENCKRLVSEGTSDREVPEVAMEDLTSRMSSLQFVPMSVKFGRGKGKAGFAKR